MWSKNLSKLQTQTAGSKCRWMTVTRSTTLNTAFSYRSGVHLRRHSLQQPNHSRIESNRAERKEGMGTHAKKHASFRIGADQTTTFATVHGDVCLGAGFSNLWTNDSSHWQFSNQQIKTASSCGQFNNPWIIMTRAHMINWVIHESRGQELTVSTCDPRTYMWSKNL
jgi:hypothetical protein